MWGNIMKDKSGLDNIIWPECKYNNHKDAIVRYGTCKGCGKVLDKKAKYNYEMFCRLRLWRKK